MADNESRPSDEELISAYCDGELRGAELARAEELLANRPEYRQLLEEYRALRARLHEVPPRTLDSNFAQRVLRRAERDILVPISSADSYVSATPPVRKKLLRWPQGRRPWIYAVMAAAAALVIMLVESKEASQERLAELGRHGALPRESEMRAAPPSSETDALGSLRKAESAGSAGTDRAGMDRAAKSAGPADAAPASAPVSAAAAPAPASPGRAAAVPKDGRNAGALGDADVQRALDRLGLPAVSLQLAQQAAEVERQQGGQMLPSDVLIVECNIAPQNRSPDPMVASFHDNSIQVDASSSSLSLETRLAKGPELKPAAGEQPVAGNSLPADMSSQEPVELFFVVATPEQLDATLADLGKRKGVSVNLLSDYSSYSSSLGAGGGGGQNRGTRMQRSSLEDEKVPAPAAADAKQHTPGLKPSEPPAGKVAAQQGRAQRLDVSEKMRRLLEAAPSTGARDKEIAQEKRDTDQLQRVPLPTTVQVEQKLVEEAKSAVSSPEQAPLQQAPLQRALFIVRTRPTEKPEKK